MKFYFAGSIRGGREKVELYIKINELLEKYGEILDRHVANPNLSNIGENVSTEEIYQRDIHWIEESDLMIAEVSMPSLGVGYELSYAERLGKRIICLCDHSVNLSAMVAGNPNFEIIRYEDSNDLLNQLNVILERI